MSYRVSGEQRKSTQLFTTEHHGTYTVLNFGHDLERLVIDLSQTDRLWQFFKDLRKRRTRVLLVTAPRGTFAPSTIDRFLEHVQQTPFNTFGPYGTRARDTEFYREDNAFRRFVEFVHDVDTFVIISLQGEVDFRYFGLALACDYRIASDDAVLVNRSLDGTVSPGVAPWFLSRFVGHAKATEIMLERTTLPATEAHELGPINTLTFPANLDAKSVALAERFSAKPSGALVALKRSMVFRSDDLAEYLQRVGTALSRLPPLTPAEWQVHRGLRRRDQAARRRVP